MLQKTRFHNVCTQCGLVKSKIVSIPSKLSPQIPMTSLSTILHLCCLSTPPPKPSFLYPITAKVEQEQWSVSLHVSKGTENSTRLHNTQNPGCNGVRRHRSTDREGRGWAEEHAMPPCSPPMTHTNLLCSNNGSIAMHKCTWTGSEGTRCRTTPQKQARRWVNTHTKPNKRSRRKRREYLALPSGVRGLKDKIQTDRNKEKIENNSTPILHLYCPSACFAWWQTMDITLNQKLSKSIWKLSVETDKELIKKAAQNVNIRQLCMYWIKVNYKCTNSITACLPNVNA